MVKNQSIKKEIIMAITKIKSGHGLEGSGLGHPENMGVSGPGGKFSGRTMPQDIDRKVNSYSDGNSGPKVGNVGMKAHKTGGMSRKGAGGVGAFKATGTT